MSGNTSSPVHHVGAPPISEAGFLCSTSSSNKWNCHSCVKRKSDAAAAPSNLSFLSLFVVILYFVCVAPLSVEAVVSPQSKLQLQWAILKCFTESMTSDGGYGGGKLKCINPEDCTGVCPIFSAVSVSDDHCTDDCKPGHGHLAFQHGSSGPNGVIGDWDISSVTDLTDLFDFTQTGYNHGGTFPMDLKLDPWGGQRSNRFFNADISKWNTARVTMTKNLFNGACAFNSDISKWDMSKVVPYTSDGGYTWKGDDGMFDNGTLIFFFSFFLFFVFCLQITPLTPWIVLCFFTTKSFLLCI